MERPATTDWLFGMAPPDVDTRWRPVIKDSIRAISSSLLGNLAISVVAGSIAGLSAWLLGLPFPVVLGVLAGVLDLIPQVGATLAAIILIACSGRRRTRSRCAWSNRVPFGEGVVNMIYAPATADG